MEWGLLRRSEKEKMMSQEGKDDGKGRLENEAPPPGWTRLRHKHPQNNLTLTRLGPGTGCDPAILYRRLKIK